MLFGLAVHADHRTGECWPSQETFADAFACNRRTVQRAFDRLRDLGLLRSTAPGLRGRQSQTHWLDFEALSRLAPADDGSHELDDLLAEYARLRADRYKLREVGTLGAELRRELGEAIATVSQQTGVTRRRVAVALVRGWFAVEAEGVLEARHRLDWIGPYLEQLTEQIAGAVHQPGPLRRSFAGAAALVAALDG